MMHIGGTSALGIFTFLSTPSSWPSIRGENGKVKFISFFETDHSARNFLTKSFPQTYTRSNKHHCYSDFLQFWTSNNLRRLTISFGKVVARIWCPLSPPGTGRVVVPHFIIWKVVQVGRRLEYNWPTNSLLAKWAPPCSRRLRQLGCGKKGNLKSEKWKFKTKWLQ